LSFVSLTSVTIKSPPATCCAGGRGCLTSECILSQRALA